MQSIQFTLTEFSNPLSATQRERLHQVVLYNPFGSFDRMALVTSEDHPASYEPFDRERVARVLLDAPSADITLLTGDEEETEGGLSLVLNHNAEKTLLRFVLREDYLVGAGGTEFLLEYVREVVSVFPKLHSGRASVLTHHPDYYRRFELRKVPKTFHMFLGWIHFLGPSSYEGFYDRDTLLKAPAHSTTTLKNGVIEIRNYVHPFDHEEAPTIETLRTMTDYLHREKMPRA